MATTASEKFTSRDTDSAVGGWSHIRSLLMPAPPGRLLLSATADATLVQVLFRDPEVALGSKYATMML